jgi:hypothetical protein
LLACMRAGLLAFGFTAWLVIPSHAGCFFVTCSDCGTGFGFGGTVRVCHLQAFLLLLLSRFSYDRREVSMDAR